jgi:NADPH:quinone reductase-like Zn-dependent oxidoreductase
VTYINLAVISHLHSLPYIGRRRSIHWSQPSLLLSPFILSELKMKALILNAEDHTANIHSILQPTPAPNELLVRVHAISLNPIDPLYVAHPLASTGRTIGSDFAGTIASLGSSIPSTSNLSIGNQVSGFLQGACSVNERPGAFAEYLTIPWDLVWKVPENIKIGEAAGVSLVALTAAQGMWYRLGLPTPFAFEKNKLLDEHPEWTSHHKEEKNQTDTLNFFIYGASTSVGLYAAQMVRLSAEASGKKIRLFGAASKARWGMLKSEPYGYEHLVDYRDGDWPEQIQKLADGKGMNYAYDCISEGESVARVSSILASKGKIAIVRSRAGGAWKADDLPVEPIYGAVWEGLGEEIQYQGFTVKKSPAARDFAVEFYKWLSGAAGSKLVPNPVRLMPGGLEKVVEDGFALLGPGKMEDRGEGRREEWMRPVSAEKLVYEI